MNDALERRGIMNIGGVAWGYIMTDILSFIHSYV